MPPMMQIYVCGRSHCCQRPTASERQIYLWRRVVRQEKVHRAVKGGGWINSEMLDYVVECR
jgi:hypothetical protein